ncbi:MAG: choice-of-anchor Q domain-containing protein [Actinomycetota bacterium]
MTDPKPSSPSGSDILAVFQDELAPAASMLDGTAAGPALWLRFVEYYRSLVRLPREAWRGLQRRWRRSLGALALLCTLGQAPVLLLRELRDLFPRFAGYYLCVSALPQYAPRGLQKQWKRSSAAIAMLLALSQAPLRAANFTVNDTADARDAVNGDGVCNTTDGVCTLRAAIQETNTLGGPDTIIVPGGIYLLSIAGTGENASAQGDLDIIGDLAIKGGGAHITVIDGGDLDRVFHALTVNAVDISDVTIQNGNASTGSGGGIFNENRPGGSLTLTNVTVTSNSATFGGGIMNFGGATTTLLNTTVDSNSADFGGGIYTRDSGPLRLINSTVSGNSASCGGGGIDTFFFATASLTNSTVSDNSAACEGGGILRESNSGEVVLTTSIIANNPSGNDCAGGVTSDGHNLDSDNTCGLTGPGDLANTDPLLGPLQDNSGPTKTHSLPTGSPAIDAIPAASCATIGDQRGVARPQDGDGDAVAECDVGAFEAVLGEPPPPAHAHAPSPAATSTPITVPACPATGTA